MLPTPTNTQEDQCSIAPMLAILYFCLYMLVCTFIMLQLIIGIIVDNIEVAEEMETMAITQVHFFCVGDLMSDFSVQLGCKKTACVFHPADTSTCPACCTERAAGLCADVGGA